MLCGISWPACIRGSAPPSGSTWKRRARSREQDNVIDAFRATGQTTDVLYGDATKIRNRFGLGGALLGGFVGMVVGGKLIALSVRRRRTEYEADPASCFACGRCYQSCPKEHERLKKTQGGGGGTRMTQETERMQVWHRAAKTTAIVGAVFTGIFTVLLVANLIGSAVLGPARELKLEKMKPEAQKDPTNETLLSEIRQLDLRIRRDRIWRLDFAQQGGVHCCSAASWSC